MLTRKDQLEKDKKVVFAKDIVTKNPIFSQQHIDEFYELFILYVDSRTRRVDARNDGASSSANSIDARRRP